MEKINLAIIDTEEEILNYTKIIEEDKEIELVGGFSGGENLSSRVLESEPDVVILDLLISGADGFDVISNIKAKNPSIKIIIASSLNSNSVVSKSVELGVDYFMIKPVDGYILFNRAKELVNNDRKSKDSELKKLEEKITNIFLTVGIPAHIKGYQFLREAIKMAVNDPHIINSITKRLYPGIAQMYDTTASKVERAIRHAIEVAWNKGKIENINDVFGLHVYDTHEKPTNGEFIALVADKMLLEK